MGAKMIPCVYIPESIWIAMDHVELDRIKEIVSQHNTSVLCLAALLPEYGIRWVEAPTSGMKFILSHVAEYPILQKDAFFL